MSTVKEPKGTKYYVDFENVHGIGLVGVDQLSENDSVIVFYSPAAETLHIDRVIEMKNSAATVIFEKVDNGTRNAADFQLITALFGTMEEGYEYAIVSKDVGFDAAIKMAERLDLQPVRRVLNLLDEPPKTKAKDKDAKGAEANATETEKQAGDPKETADSQERAQADADQKKPDSGNGKNGKSGRNGRNGQGKQQNGKKQPQPKLPAATEPKALPPKTEESARTPSRRERISTLLAGKGESLKQAQLSTVMKCLNETKDKQGFYRAIIKEEGREKGLALYHRIRGFYTDMSAIVCD